MKEYKYIPFKVVKEKFYEVFNLNGIGMKEIPITFSTVDILKEFPNIQWENGINYLLTELEVDKDFIEVFLNKYSILNSLNQIPMIGAVISHFTTSLNLLYLYYILQVNWQGISRTKTINHMVDFERADKVYSNSINSFEQFIKNYGKDLQSIQQNNYE